MAILLGCLAMSHAPQLMLDPDQWHLLKNREHEPLPAQPELEKETREVRRAKWNNCFAAIGKLQARLAELRPDVIILVGDDQHENLVDDAMPPFTIFIGSEAEASTSLRYLNQPHSENRLKYRVDQKLAESLVQGLLDQGFDPAYSKRTRYSGGLGHAFARVLKFLTPGAEFPIVPVMVNTYYPPAPAPSRCLDFGRALGAQIRRFPDDRRVVIIASGGLSHTMIDEPLDRDFIAALEHNDLRYMASMPAQKLVEGTSEIRNWIVAAGAVERCGTLVGYVPLYRTNTGVGCAMGFAYW